MKLLFQTTSRVELDAIKIKLESVGIPVFIGNEDSARNFGLVMPARSFACWTPLEDQYDDAVKFLNDETHIVESGVDINDYYASLELRNDGFLKNVVDKLMLVVVLMFICSFALFVYFKISDV